MSRSLEERHDLIPQQAKGKLQTVGCIGWGAQSADNSKQAGACGDFIGNTQAPKCFNISN